jgi:hypothetical protein
MTGLRRRPARWGPAAAVAGVAAIHFALSVGLGMYVFLSGMARFDEGGPRSYGESAAAAVATVLLFPAFGTGLEDRLPAIFRQGGFPWEHSVLAANSLLWAIAVVALARRWAWKGLGLAVGLAVLVARPAAAQAPAPAPPAPPAGVVPAAQLARYTGFYDAGSTIVEVTLAGGQLLVAVRRLPGKESYRLRPLGSHRFTAEEDAELRVTFEMGRQVAERVVIAWRDVTLRARRIVD